MQKGVKAMLFNRLFRSKDGVPVEALCQIVYDSFFRQDDGHTARTRQDLWDSILDSLIKTDGVLIKTDRVAFTNELTAAALEVFGLAWMHHFMSEEFAERQTAYVCAEIAFTKRYLERYAFQHIWKAMGAYNDAADKALSYLPVSAVDRDFAPLLSFGSVASTAIGAGRRRNMMVMAMTTAIMEEHPGQMETEVANHVSKRTSTRDDWGRHPIALFLALTITRRLQWTVEVESQVLAGLTAVIDRLYNDSKAAIESVTLREPIIQGKVTC
jgi:hypothetical protein